MSSFSFAFTGDDIEGAAAVPPPIVVTAPDLASAFPVQGKPQLPAQEHRLPAMLALLPSKIAFDVLDVALDDGQTLYLPRRPLWDVRVQALAEAEPDDPDADGMGLGRHDVKTGVYEGGFKSWESSVDLVKVLAAKNYLPGMPDWPVRIIELGAGTALPTLALFLWAMRTRASQQPGLAPHLSLVIADYNPRVLQLVTLPNFILAWALEHKDTHPALREALSLGDELELTPSVLASFQSYLIAANISLEFVSGGWSPAFVDLVYDLRSNSAVPGPVQTLVLGAETIYSPFALQAFTETLFAILDREVAGAALVAAKKLYFGVGGSLDDFVDKARGLGAEVTSLREEKDGVRRGVVQCVLKVTTGT